MTLDPSRPMPSSPDLLGALLHSGPDGLWVAAADGRILDANPAACAALGHSRASLSALAALDLEEAPCPEGALRREGGLRRADGSLLAAEITSIPLDDGRTVTWFRALPEDDGQSRWWQAMALSGLPLVLVDHASGRLLRVNRAYAEARGYAPEEMVGMTLGQVLAPPWPERLGRITSELEQDGHLVFEATNLRKDGSTFPVLVDTTLIRDGGGRPHLRFTHVMDLTALRRAESEREAGLTFMRELIDAIPDLVWFKDSDGIYRECNARCERLFDLPRASILGRDDFDLAGREDAEYYREHDRMAVAAGRLSRNEEVVSFQDDGHVEILETLKAPIFDPEGRLLGVLGIGRDITARKADEEQLRISEEKFHQAFHTAPLLASMSHREDGRIIDANECYCRTLGYAREELVGRTSLELGIYSPEVRERLIEALAPTGRVQHLELPVQGRDGTTFPCVFFAEAFRVGGEDLLLVMALDIRERRKAEELQRKLDAEQFQMQKLESLGSLASGVAHDMNNVLAAILAVTETLRERHGDDPRLAKPLRLVETAAARGRDLVKGLTNFARKDMRDPELLDLNALVAEEAQLLARTTLQKVHLELELDPALPRILAERGSLASALMNLCLNAVDAMPAGGTLALRTRALPDGQVELRVEDTGEGMAPDVQARALEPFFTTKPVGRGTGLGLSMAYATLKAHGGGLELDSTEGQGTAVTLRLPAAAGDQASPGSAEPGAGARQALRILLVDDDELVLASLPGLIETLGHTVSAFASGREALARLEAGEPCDALVLDLNMPDLNGAELLKALRRSRPAMPVVMGTGFLDEATAALLRGDPHVRSLLKPYTRAGLDAKLQEIVALEEN